MDFAQLWARARAETLIDIAFGAGIRARRHTGIPEGAVVVGLDEFETLLNAYMEVRQLAASWSSLDE